MSMPVSQLDIINQALIELGKPPVNAFGDTPASLALNYKIDLLFPLLLLKTNWNDFVKFTIINTPNTTSFSPDFAYTYTLPANFGRLFKFGNFTFPVIYEIFDGLIAANVKPIQFYYIVNSANYNNSSAQFWRALSVWAASDTCMVLTNNDKLTEYLSKKSDMEINNAILLDNMNKELFTVPYNSFNRQIYI
jgi:hypothetical protein